MPTDPRIDEYITKARPFARPILKHLRNLIRKTCPDMEETIKWGMPHFEHKGTIAHMAAFSQHCAFGFKKAAMIPDPEGIMQRHSGEAMGNFGRIARLADLPPDEVLIRFTREAFLLNESGKKVPSKKRQEKESAEAPADFLQALKSNPVARKHFNAFAPGHRREYVEWITEAKRPQTRENRIRQAVEMISGGKNRNWKYESGNRSNRG